MNVGAVGLSSAARATSSQPQPAGGPAPLVNLREVPGLVFQDDDRPEVQEEMAALRRELTMAPAERCRAQVLRGWSVTDRVLTAMSPDEARDMNARIDAEVDRRMQISASGVRAGYGVDETSIWYTYGTVPPTASTAELLQARVARAGS